MSVETEIDIEYYYDRFGAMVYRRCMRILQDEEEAIDATQDVFVKLLSKRDQLKGTHPSSLLYRIATNLCLNKIKKNSRYSPSCSDDLLQNLPAAESYGLNFEKEALWNYILREDNRSTDTVASMYFLYGMTLKEISKETEFSVSTVFNRIKALCDDLKQKEI